MRVTSSLASTAPDTTLRSSDQLRDEGAGIAAHPSNQQAQLATTMVLIVAVTSSAISTTTM